MNRRKLLESVFKLAIVLPFAFVKRKQDEPVIFGVDKAKEGSDQTILSLSQNAELTGVFILDRPLSESEHDLWLMKNDFGHFTK